MRLGEVVLDTWAPLVATDCIKFMVLSTKTWIAESPLSQDKMLAPVSRKSQADRSARGLEFVREGTGRGGEGFKSDVGGECHLCLIPYKYDTPSENTR
jgi:hypothetical protein